MSETIEAATPAEVAATELSIAFSTEEMVVLGRALGEQLGVLGSAPLAAIAPSARDDVLASAARSLRARNVLTGTPDLPAVDRAVAGLVQIAARPALRSELTLDRGATLHRRYLAIPYASVQYDLLDDGLHRLTPFATNDLLARMMRQADFVERPTAEVDGFDLPYGTLRRVEAAARAGDLAAANAAFAELALSEDAPAIDAASIERFIAALAEGRPVNAVRLVHAASPTRSVGGEVAWIDGGDAGIWQLPTIDQPFAVVGATGGVPVPSIDPDADVELADRDRRELDAATVRVEPVAATELASFLFGLLPTQQIGELITADNPPPDPTPSLSG